MVLSSGALHLTPSTTQLSTLDFTTFFLPLPVKDKCKTAIRVFFFICIFIELFEVFFFIWTSYDEHPNSSDVVEAWVSHQDCLNRLILNRGLILTNRFGFLPGVNYRHCLLTRQYYYGFVWIEEKIKLNLKIVEFRHFSAKVNKEKYLEPS